MLLLRVFSTKYVSEYGHMQLRRASVAALPDLDVTVRGTTNSFISVSLIFIRSTASYLPTDIRSGGE